MNSFVLETFDARALLQHVKRDGGATLTRVGWRHFLPNSGYAVGVTGGTGTSVEMSLAEAETASGQFELAVHSIPGALGGIRLEGNKLYIEPVEYRATAGDAYVLARVHKQRFVYDFAARKSLPVEQLVEAPNISARPLVAIAV